MAVFEAKDGGVLKKNAVPEWKDCGLFNGQLLWWWFCDVLLFYNNVFAFLE